MVRIAPVNLSNNPKTLWFDAGDLEIHEGDGVVVTTARGTEFGRLADCIFEVTEDQVEKLKSPLKPVIRVATPEDEQHAEVMLAKSAEALPVFKEMAAEMNEGMRPVSVEYLFDGDKAVFYFEAEDRVDFRELVRKLAAYFHVRIDMRQIGVRDEARLIGGLGHCGQELCCKRLGGEFCPVSIRMAKEQDLSLNPQKISGVCGRLMCCLRYEYDAYKDFNKRAPKRNATVQTPDGPAKVVDLDVPREIIVVRIEGEKPVRVPLSVFEPVEGEGRPSVIGAEAWTDALEQSHSSFGSASTSLLTGQLSAIDKLADPKLIRHTGSASNKKVQEKPEKPEKQDKTDKQDKAEKSGKASKRGAKQSASTVKTSAKPAPKSPVGRKRSAAVEGSASEVAAAPARTPRRRRSTKIEVGTAIASDATSKKAIVKSAPVKTEITKVETAKPLAISNKSVQGDNVRGVREDHTAHDAREGRTDRTPRRHSRGGAAADQRKYQSDKQGAKQNQRPKQNKGTQDVVKPTLNAGLADDVSRGNKPAVRPGQKSSGVRRSHEIRTAAPKASEQTQGAADVAGQDASRRPRKRRRNRKPDQDNGQQ